MSFSRRKDATHVVLKARRHGLSSCQSHRCIGVRPTTALRYSGLLKTPDVRGVSMYLDVSRMKSRDVSQGSDYRTTLFTSRTQIFLFLVVPPPPPLSVLATYQGATQLTRMWSLAHSQAQFFVAWVMAALVMA